MAFHKININSTDFELAPKKVKSCWGPSTTNKNLFIPYLSNGPGPGTVVYGSTEVDYNAAEILVANTTSQVKDDPRFFYNPSQNAVGATKFIGDLEGNATTANSATKVLITTQTASDDFPIIFGQSDSVTSTGVKSVHVDAHLNYNPSTNTLTTTNFAGTATNAKYIHVAPATNTADASYYIQFVNGRTGNRKSYTDANLQYNSKTNILTTTQVNAKLNGPVQTTATSTNASYYISFVNGSDTGMRYSYVDAGLYYNPSTNTLTTGKLCGYFVSDKDGSWTQAAHNGQAAVVNDATGSGGSLVCLASMTAKNGRITIGTIPQGNPNFYFSYHKTGNTGNPDKQMIWDYQANTLSASGGFYESSDERLKDFQEDIEVNFSYLHNIPKKYYSWKDDTTYTRHIGTSAQEVQKYYPELVNTDNDGYLTMNYDKLSVVALKAIDVLHEEVTELKKENAELKERLARLEELILNR